MAVPSKIASFFGTLILVISLSEALQINVIEGQSVLLHCVVDPPPPPQRTRVYWQTDKVTRSDKVHVVHFVNMGEEEPQFQASQYKYRTTLDLSQLPSGNFSLLLMNVTKEDNQTTICCLYSIDRHIPVPVSRTTLTVLDRPNTPDDKPDGSDAVSFPAWATGLIVGVLLLLLVACMAVLIYKVRKKAEFSSITGAEVSGSVNYDEKAVENEKLALNGAEKSIEERSDIV